MKIYFSPSSTGFYNDDVHGPRFVSSPDPAWSRPVLEDTGEPDMSLIQPTVLVANADTKIPADAVEVSPERWRQLLEDQSNGMSIVCGGAGQPKTVARPAPQYSLLKEAELVAYRADREKMLNRLAGIGMAAQVEGNGTLATAVCAFRKGLLDLPAHPTITGAKTLPELKAAFKTQYGALLAATPNAVKAAFAGVDA
jgi:hypothetical protein